MIAKPKAKKTKAPLTREQRLDKYYKYLSSVTRKLSMYWPEGEEYLRSVRRRHISGKYYEYPCEICHVWFKREEVEKDHIIPCRCGTMRSIDDFCNTIKRTLIKAEEGWQCLCKPCHAARTAEQRKNK